MDEDRGYLDLKVEDTEREKIVPSGIYVRALDNNGRWEAVDICRLDAASLLLWLRSRGGYNPWAENVVGILLGHKQL